MHDSHYLWTAMQDKVWMTEINFLPFTPPTHLSPMDGGTRGATNFNVDPLWVESTDMLDEDLHWLLQLEYHKFWSQASVVLS